MNSVDEIPIRILIVDDEAALMRALCETLQEHGYAVQGCTSGESALAMLTTERHDLLLSDLMMPDMDGIALLRAALRIDPDLVGLIMTGQGTIASAVAAMKVGALDYILKPFKISEIVPVLSRAITVRRLRLENTRLQERLREYARELEQRVEARTAQLARQTEELMHANQELERSNIELRRFAYVASHDLQSPTRAICGFAQLLQRRYGGQFDAQGEEWITRLVEAGERMSALIYALIDHAEIDANTRAFEPVALDDAIDDALRLLRGPIHDTGAVITRGTLGTVIGDRSQLAQLLQNLIGNALKFCRGHAPEVTISARPREELLEISIADNGIGIPLESLEQVFEIFRRLQPRQEYPGTGVGLAVCRRIVERHGGRIWAESRVEGGSVFRLTLPRAPEAGERVRPPASGPGSSL